MSPLRGRHFQAAPARRTGPFLLSRQKKWPKEKATRSRFETPRQSRPPRRRLTPCVRIFDSLSGVLATAIRSNMMRLKTLAASFATDRGYGVWDGSLLSCVCVMLGGWYFKANL